MQFFLYHFCLSVKGTNQVKTQNRIFHLILFLVWCQQQEQFCQSQVLPFLYWNLIGIMATRTQKTKRFEKYSNSCWSLFSDTARLAMRLFSHEKGLISGAARQYYSDLHVFPPLLSLGNSSYKSLYCIQRSTQNFKNMNKRRLHYN